MPSNVSVLFYGGCWMVVTRVDGLPECLAGPFPTEQAALDWIGLLLGGQPADPAFQRWPDRF